MQHRESGSLGRDRLAPALLGAVQQVRELVKTDVQMLGHRRANMRQRRVTAGLPMPHRGHVNTKPFSERLLRESNSFPPVGEGDTSFGHGRPSLT